MALVVANWPRASGTSQSAPAPSICRASRVFARSNSSFSTSRPLMLGTSRLYGTGQISWRHRLSLCRRDAPLPDSATQCANLATARRCPTLHSLFASCREWHCRARRARYHGPQVQQTGLGVAPLKKHVCTTQLEHECFVQGLLHVSKVASQFTLELSFPHNVEVGFVHALTQEEGAELS